MTSAFDSVDAVHRVGRYLVRRARPEDAAEYSRVDAELVTTAYAGLMPPEFAVRQLAEVPQETVRRRAEFARDLVVERAGAEPERRNWLALEDDRIVAIAVSSDRPQPWEDTLAADPVPGISRQLDHLYLHSSTWGTGLANALLELALPDGMAAYLWIVAGNDRAWRFYERHGFVGDGREYPCGPQWYHQVLHRMVRSG
nr:GNAT family N-acetyltransferase [Propionicimonas sp.]